MSLPPCRPLQWVRLDYGEGKFFIPDYLLGEGVLVMGDEGDVAPAVCVQMRIAKVAGNNMWDGLEGFNRFIGMLLKWNEAQMRQFFPKDSLVKPQGEEGEEDEEDETRPYHPLLQVDKDIAAGLELSPEIKREYIRAWCSFAVAFFDANAPVYAYRSCESAPALLIPINHTFKPAFVCCSQACRSSGTPASPTCGGSSTLTSWTPAARST